jgi:flagellar basal body-associated protein FliL
VVCKRKGYIFFFNAVSFQRDSARSLYIYQGRQNLKREVENQIRRVVSREEVDSLIINPKILD